MTDEVSRADHAVLTAREDVSEGFSFEANILDLPIAVVVVGSDGLIRAVNGQFSSRVGYSGADVVGKNVNVLVPKRVQDRHQALLESYFERPSVRSMGSLSSKVSILRADGAEVPAEIALIPCDNADCAAALISLLSASGPQNWTRSLVLALLVLLIGVVLEVLSQTFQIHGLPDGSLMMGGAVGSLIQLMSLGTPKGGSA